MFIGELAGRSLSPIAKQTWFENKQGRGPIQPVKTEGFTNPAAIAPPA
jgi:hypothetical protein